MILAAFTFSGVSLKIIKSRPGWSGVKLEFLLITILYVRPDISFSFLEFLRGYLADRDFFINNSHAIRKAKKRAIAVERGRDSKQYQSMYESERQQNNDLYNKNQELQKQIRSLELVIKSSVSAGTFGSDRKEPTSEECHW